MQRSYKYYNGTFSVSVSEINDQYLQLKILSAIEDVFKGFIVSNNNSSPIMNFTFTDHIESFFLSDDFVRREDIKISKDQTYFKDQELGFILNHSNPFDVIIHVCNNETLLSSRRYLDIAYLPHHWRTISRIMVDIRLP